MQRINLILVLMICAAGLAACMPSEALHSPHDVDRMDNGTTIITDGGNWEGCESSKVLAVDETGKILWVYDEGLCWAHSADLQDNGHIIISDTGNDRVFELDTDWNIFWTSDETTFSDGSHLDYPNDANILQGDTILITDRDNHRAFETDRAGNILWQFGETGVPGADDYHLNGPHNADRLSDGNTIIADSNNDRIVEVDPSGEIVWEYNGPLNWPRDADVLDSGNVLICDSQNNRVIEIDRAGETVWTLGPLNWPYDADRLAGGNTLVADLMNLRVIEVTEAQEVVWEYSYESAPTGEEQTVGLFVNEASAFEGYTLFAPQQYTTTYLIDNDGLLVHSWESAYTPGNAAYLLESGNLLRTGFPGPDANPVFHGGGQGGVVQEIAWDGTVVWEFEYSSTQHMSHHDVEYMPNGHVLMIAWEYKSRAEAIAAGRKPGMISDGQLWPDHIIEVAPQGTSGGTIVWEWHVWDHLVQDFDPSKANYGVVSQNPELIDINYSMGGGTGQGKADWNHINSVDYNEELDQIVVSVHELNEIWIIDHSTTTEEAAGHAGGNSGMGGDLLYRWGNPRAYGRGGSADQQFFGQHDAQWIEAGNPGEGNILVYNNGMKRPDGAYSTVEEIVPPVDGSSNYELEFGAAYGPDEPTWIYQASNPFDFYSQNISGAERMPNGNTLICAGAGGTLFEVTPEGETVWEYISPVTEDGPVEQGDPFLSFPYGYGPSNAVFKIRRYAPDYPGLEGQILTPGDPVETYPTTEPPCFLATVLGDS